MSTQRQQVGVRDLVEEAKKRIVFLAICVVGLSYLMSLTSSSVWVNLPAAASLIIILRYLSLDYDMRRKAAAYNSKPSSANATSQNKPLQWPKTSQKSEWRRKVNSPVAEEALDQFTWHLVSEFVTDLWYSRLTPDRQAPEELANIVNGVFGEISARMRNINLIDLLTRDLINLICTHLELFRMAQAKIEKQQSGLLTIEKRDAELRLVLAAENKLHPALFSAESEHKVLQHLMDGLISFTFKPEDLQCSLFRCIVRELLACAVMRPVINLASPRFINERIELLVIKMTGAKGVTQVQEESQSKPEGPSKISTDHFSRFLDPSVTGVELVQLKNGQSRTAVEARATENVNGSKDPLLSVELDTQSSRSWSSLPKSSQSSNERGIERKQSGGEWGDMLDLMSRRKTQALAPENFENMWAKGRNYKKKEGENSFEHSFGGKAVTVDHIMAKSRPKDKEILSKFNCSERSTSHSGCTPQLKVDNACRPQARNIANRSPVPSYQEDDEHNHMASEEDDSGSSTSYTSKDEETDSVTGLDSPGTKVWDGRSNRNMAMSHIHHPLENSERRVARRTGKGNLHLHRLSKTQSGQKKSRPSNKKLPIWQEVERTSFLSGDGQDILYSPKGHANIEDSSDDSDIESLGRINSGAATSSSAISFPGSHSLTFNSLKNTLSVDSFFKLKCEVSGANIVKSGSKTFAVYSISVTDVNSNNSWSIKRRFRHFEELHRHLKEFPEYHLHLPPKHFLSTGLDLAVIQERCKLLDEYVKKLLQLPRISGSIEVWDFLSVDSQTYAFTNSFSIIETLSDKPSEESKKVSNIGGPMTDPHSFKREHIGIGVKDSALQLKNNVVADGLRVHTKGSSSQVKSPGKEFGKSLNNSVIDLDTGGRRDASSRTNLGKTTKGREEQESELFRSTDTDPTLPTEWVPPNLSVPILDLVDVIFQLQDGGWIRRKAFWVAKQILQLGMGDAFDDWLIEKIQLLRKGLVVASGIKRVEQILWPDGIFITKHPKRRQPPSLNLSQKSPQGQKPTEISSPRVDEQQQQEADRRAKLVYELMIDKAPPAIVSLVGSKEYEKCAKDVYFFLQSSVCLKQLAFGLVELLLVSAFPELDYVFKQVHEEKHRFGEFKPQ